MVLICSGIFEGAVVILYVILLGQLFCVCVRAYVRVFFINIFDFFSLLCVCVHG